MFQRILIANRGEIACRVIDTARRLGIGTVAVFSDADRDALHVARADQAVHIGEAPAAQSYLRAERILQAARDTGATAVHPGYGFLSENADFARQCEEAGLVFIGPSANAIEAMGSKARAKEIMAEAGVPLIPGYHGADQSDHVLRERADAMGYPVLLKATAGGGGKGMRAVASGDGFAEALAAARRESRASFGDDRMLVEKLLEEPRHVEVQVFCDAHGNAVYLSERDCSIQRRHQKVVEEAPAPGLSEALRRAMGEAAVNAARAIDYRGAGTVEFLLARDHTFCFMEMNTRLQVEHPVTEMITGLDLVEWQLRVAAGEALPLSQEDIRLSGHAIEARIYAEDPEQDFVPSTGRIHFLRTPEPDTSVRIDTGVVEGAEISPFYDPMIAKLIVHGESREDARRRLVSALSRFHVAGVANNTGYLKRIVEHPAFAQERLTTGFIEEHQAELRHDTRGNLGRNLCAAALALAHQRRQQGAPTENDPNSPWRADCGWRVNAPARQTFDLAVAGDAFSVELRSAAVATHGENQRLIWGSEELSCGGKVEGEWLTLIHAGRTQTVPLAMAPVDAHGAHILFFDDGAFEFSERETELGDSAAAAGDASFAAPMHGAVVALLVEPGTRVEAGDPVIVIEAMKMEQTLRAPGAGTVVDFNYAPGDLVDRGATLVDFNEEHRA